MLITSQKTMDKKQMEDFVSIYREQLMSENALNSDAYKDKFPKTYISMKELADNCVDYFNLINKLEIIKLLQKYITVNDLER